MSQKHIENIRHQSPYGQKIYGADLSTVRGAEVTAEKARIDWSYYGDVDVERIQALLTDLVKQNLKIRLFPSDDDPTYRYFGLEGL